MKLVALIFEEEGRTALVTGTGLGADRVAAETRVTEPDMAKAVLKEIDERAKKAGIKLEDLVIVFKDQYGKTRLKQARHMTAGKGAKRGSFWGLLVGLLLGGPIGGLLGGMVIGAIYGKKVDHGLDDEFIRNTAQALEQGESAVLVLLKPEDYKSSIAFLRSFDTKIYEAEFSSENEAAVLKAAEDESVQQAIKTEFDVE